jgi:hypothetical protein
MSTWDDLSITCPFCAHVFDVQIASGLHISRLPHIRERIIDGRLHRFDCPACTRTIEVRRPLIYADFERGDWIEVWPADDIAHWPELAAKCSANYRRAIERGAPMLRAHSERFRVRIVFGYDELREKLLVWDARLDDVAIECLKLVAIRRDVSIFGERDRILVAEIEPPRITFARFRGDVRDASFEVELSVDDLAHMRAEIAPILAITDPFASVNRVLGAYGLRGP